VERTTTTTMTTTTTSQERKMHWLRRIAGLFVSIVLMIFMT
jgi:hypothetical protein